MPRGQFIERCMVAGALIALVNGARDAGEAAGKGKWHLPYSAPCVQREEVFEFSKKPAVRLVGKDRYEITFAVKAMCDAAVALVDADDGIVRHLACGVLGANAPKPFQKSLEQKILWDGKDDMGVYVKEPEKLKLRVSLGLKPTFDRILGWSPYDMRGEYRGVVAAKSGIYVLTSTDNKASKAGHPQLRRYDRDGSYAGTVVPQPGGVALEKLAGMESLEIEPGKRVFHSSVGHDGFVGTISGYGCFLPGGLAAPQRPCVSGDTLIYANSSAWTYAARKKAVSLYRLNLADGTAPEGGYAWRRLSRPGKRTRTEFAYTRFKIAASPDGKWIYLAGPGKGAHSRGGGTAVYRLDARTNEPLSQGAFLGEERKPGSDNAHFNLIEDLACDAQGRLYVCDYHNNRIQVYSGEGKHLKSIRLSRPMAIRIHRGNGAIYVYHEASLRGVSKMRLVKLKSFEDPTNGGAYVMGAGPRYYLNYEPQLAVDEWSSPVRVWVNPNASHLIVLEDRGKKFEVVRDFHKEVKKAGLEPGMMATRFSKVTADPTREHVYYQSSRGMFTRYDLRTGAWKRMRMPANDFGPDWGFDKRGYLYTHIKGSVHRHLPSRVDRRGQMFETPLDYGDAGEDHGAVALRDQGGAKGFQDGFGVNMRGDFVAVSNIFYVPRFEDAARPLVAATFGSITGRSYERMMTDFRQQERKGVDLYAVKRWPGRLLSGGTIWTFDRTGELRGEDLVSGLGLVNGATIDEDGAIYVVFNSPRMVGGVPFLADRGEVIGTGKRSDNPFTGTLMKVPPSGAKILRKKAPLPLPPEEAPKRPTDLAHNGGFGYETNSKEWRSGSAWVEGAEWLYAGASPIIPVDCSCPNMRHYTDWFKRTYIPEAYRHSVGILDTNGNLLMHLGRYGNADSGREIAFAHVHYVSATDNYLVVSDVGNERIVVLKLDYHTRETAPVTLE